MKRALSRPERIRRRPEYLRVQRCGTKIYGRFLSLFVLPNQLNVTRLGIIATRRLGGAIQRNRAKRIVREIFRYNKGQIVGPSLDVVVMPHPGFGDVPFKRLQSDYLATLQRYAGLR